MKSLGAIVHATDLSKASDRAFRTAVELARDGRSELLLLHVQVPPGSFTAAAPPPDYLAFLAQARAATQRRLAAVLTRARKRGVRAQALLTEGAPAQQIVRTARRRNARMIVMGTHGRTGLRRVFMGSVAERVLQRAPCPVLTVRA